MKFPSRGFTLVEFVIAIVVIAIAAAVLLRAFVTPLVGSVDPQRLVQARAIAGSYLDEILLRDYGAGPGDCAGSMRGTYDTIWCYNGLSEAPTDQFGTPIDALSDYVVTVTVSPVGGALADVAVRVQHGDGVDTTLLGRRSDY
jgi:MSHA pilin protein MshD